jgi:hypothetical protein
MYKRVLLASAAALLAVPALADAPNSGLWKMVGDWQIRVDKSLGYGCFMWGGYRNGNVVRLGIDNRSRQYYLLFGNPSWHSIVPGQQYYVQISFNGQPPTTWVGNGSDVGDGARALTFAFSNPAIWTAFAQAYNVSFFYQGHLLGTQNLPMSDLAVREMFACQQAFSPNSSPPSDPFRSPVDPFTGS